MSGLDLLIGHWLVNFIYGAVAGALFASERFWTLGAYMLLFYVMFIIVGSVTPIDFTIMLLVFKKTYKNRCHKRLQKKHLRLFRDGNRLFRDSNRLFRYDN